MAKEEKAPAPSELENLVGDVGRAVDTANDKADAVEAEDAADTAKAADEAAVEK